MKKRLLSIDVMRGMTIFFMIIVNDPGSWQHIYAPLEHSKWNGCTPTDLVFPFFVFIVGLSMSFSFLKFEHADRSVWIKKVLRRTALIFLVGLLLNWFPFYNKSIGDLRILGVLQRIALAYGIGALIIIFVRQRWLVYVLAAILLGYWGLMLVLGGPNPLSLEDNIVRTIDLWLFGERHVYHGYGIPFDPEGLFSTIPTVGTVLVGYLIGKTMQKVEMPMQKIIRILPWGIGLVLGGVAWNFLGFPINKPIWSSSYVLYAGGLATLLLSLLIWIIDVQGWKKWAYVFRVFGLNPLASYALSGLVIRIFGMIKIGDQGLYGWLYTHVFQHAGDQFGSLLQAITYAMVIWLFAWWLYKNKKVIKL